MSLVTFTITDELIAHGTRGIACECPATLAMELAEPPVVFGSVRVYYDHITIGGKPCPTPGDLRAWVEAFDRGEQVDPATFTVDTDAVYEPAYLALIEAAG